MEEENLRHRDEAIRQLMVVECNMYKYRTNWFLVF